MLPPFPPAVCRAAPSPAYAAASARIRATLRRPAAADCCDTRPACRGKCPQPSAPPRQSARHALSPGRASRHLPARAPTRSIHDSRTLRNLPSACARLSARCAGFPCRWDVPRAPAPHRSSPAEFPPRSRKRDREVPRLDRPEKTSLWPLDSLIHRRVVLMNHVEPLRQTKQALRLPHKQISFRLYAAMEFVNQTLLLRLVEINHHVAAENRIVSLRQIFRLQIVKVELHQALQRRFHRIFVAHLVEVAQPARVIHRLHLRFRVDSLL